MASKDKQTGKVGVGLRIRPPGLGGEDVPVAWSWTEHAVMKLDEESGAPLPKSLVGVDAVFPPPANAFRLVCWRNRINVMDEHIP